MARIKLGRPVVYTSRDGFQKAAVITGTRQSVTEGTGVSRPEKGKAHLHITSATGKSYDRKDVPLADEVGQPGTFALA